MIKKTGAYFARLYLTFIIISTVSLLIAKGFTLVTINKIIEIINDRK